MTGFRFMASSLSVLYANTPREQTRPATEVSEGERWAVPGEFPDAGRRTGSPERQQSTERQFPKLPIVKS
jgi:hypothetical protein